MRFPCVRLTNIKLQFLHQTIQTNALVYWITIHIKYNN